MRRLALAVMFVPLACTDQTPSPAAHPQASANDDISAVQQLLPQGEYRLAGADGKEVNLGHAITVSVTHDTIAVVSQCVRPRWQYAYAGAKLTTQPIAEAMCERGRAPAEVAIEAVFDQPAVVMRTPANGIDVAGGGHHVTLFLQ